MNALPKIAIWSPAESSGLSRNAIFFKRIVSDQNMNRMVIELETADKRLIHTATSTGSAKKENIRPKIINSGAPGG